MKCITLVAGARPNFMKIAPIIRSLEESKTALLDYNFVITGQHCDKEMSSIFFKELGLPKPDCNLKGFGSTHAEQTASIMLAFERHCQKYSPDLILVVGDVNSTLACAIVAKKLQIKLAHVEAGLRSKDRSMPEEINRLVTDSISDIFFVTESSGVKNLLREGHHPDNIFHVGNVMIDNLLFQYQKLTEKSSKPLKFQTDKIKTQLNRYAVLTIHRPSNVDNPKILGRIIKAINKVSLDIPVIFPVHPRTRRSLDKFNIKCSASVHLVPPLSYMEFLNIWKDSVLVLTDSGGLQEETSALNIPCITLRENTERPITIEKGTNKLVGTNYDEIVRSAISVLNRKKIETKGCNIWKKDASKHIVDIISQRVYAS